MSRIYRRLFLTYVFVVLICLGLVGAISSFSLKRFYQHRIANELETNALLVKNILNETTEVQVIQNLVLELSRQIGARITVVDSKGDVLGDSEEDPAKMENHINRPEIKTAFDSVEDKLHRQCGEYQTQQAADDIGTGLTQPAHDFGGEKQRYQRQQQHD